MDSSKRLLYFGMSLFAFIPIIPNNLKGLPVIVLFLISIYSIVKHRKFVFNLKKVLFFSSPYLLLLVSLIHTQNFSQVDKLLTTRLSLLILPISFGFITSSVKQVKKNDILFFLKLYFVVTFIYCLLILAFLYYNNLLNSDVNIETKYAHITHGMWKINQHPIYASMFIFYSIMFGIKLFLIEKRILIKILLVSGLILMISTLLFFSRKSVLLGTLLALSCFFFFRYNSLNFKKQALIIFLIFGLSIFIFPNVKNRFKETISATSYNQIDEKNSSSLRFGIYKCSIKKIKQSPIIGYGLGDVKDELNKCYESTSKVLLANNYNSHNQYFSYSLIGGVFGLAIIIIFLFKNFKIALKQKNALFLSIIFFYSIIMFFENILERQSGVILFSFFINFFAFIEAKEE